MENFVCNKVMRDYNLIWPKNKNLFVLMPRNLSVKQSQHNDNYWHRKPSKAELN